MTTKGDKDYFNSCLGGYMSSATYYKNVKRINDIKSKSKGDEDKEIQLATTQANRITVKGKSLNRFRVAEYLNYPKIADIFMRRAFDLEQVDTGTYRDWQIGILL